MQHIVFVTLFLGLVSGVQPVELKVDPGVQSVRLMLGAREMAKIEHAPWTAKVDFGALAPQELVAVGYDASGAEVARTSQIVNLPRPLAEVSIVLDYDGSQRLSGAHLLAQHLQREPLKSASLTLDDKRIALDRGYRAALPPLDLAHPHVIAAEGRFADGVMAHGEAVVGGTWTVGAQLTPTLLLRTTSEEKAVEHCFGVRTAALERPNAHVLIVRDPDPLEAKMTLDPRGNRTSSAEKRVAPLERGAEMMMMWPVGESAGGATLFDNDAWIDSSQVGMLWMLTRATHTTRGNAPRHYADAVAVAGVNALAGAQRRAVVLILGAADTADVSQYKPADVRRYVESIGVPLFVWTLHPQASDAAWGELEDISTQTKFRAAVERLGKALDAQRIAWVDTDPLSATRLEAKEDCGYRPFGR